MDFENIQSWILPFASSIAIILAGVAFFFTKLREMKDNASRELIDTLKETALAEREKAERLHQENKALLAEHQKQIASMEKQINDINIELTNIKARAAAAEQSKKEYLEIIQGRNPEIQVLLTDIRDFMRSLSERSQTNQKRNEKIDKDTENEEGNIMRKESEVNTHGK